MPRPRLKIDVATLKPKISGNKAIELRVLVEAFSSLQHPIAFGLLDQPVLAVPGQKLVCLICLIQCMNLNDLNSRASMRALSCRASCRTVSSCNRGVGGTVGGAGDGASLWAGGLDGAGGVAKRKAREADLVYRYQLL